MQRVSTAPQFLRTAKALLLRRRTKEAINLLRRGLNLDPACTEAALLLGKSLVAMKRLGEARELLERLVARDDSAAAFLLLLRVLMAQEDLPAATEAAQRALARHPEDARLAELAGRLRQTTKASQLAELAASTRHPSSPGSPVEPEELPTVRAPEDSLEDRPTEQLTEAPQGPRPAPPREVLLPLPALVSRREAEELDSDTATTANPITPTLAAPVPSRLLERTKREGSSGLGPRAAPVRTPQAVPEEEVSEATPSTPMPSDELDFDRRPTRGAPDLISAVRQLVEPDRLEDPTPRRPLFAGLIDEAGSASGKPSGGLQRSSTAATRLERPVPGDFDPAEIGGPTPPASPAAKHRQAGRTPRPGAGGAARPPLLQLVGGKLHRFDDSRVVRPVGGELVALDSPAPEPTMPAAAGPRVLVPGASRVTTSPVRIPVEPLPTPRSIFYRWWPLVLALALSAVCAGMIGGLMVRRAAEGRQHLAAARDLALEHEVEPLRAALHRLRAAANLAGRKPEILALAAVVHARLAVELGESDPSGAETLLEEAVRLDAERHPEAAADVALARAYLRLARRPLPEAIAFIFKALEQHPGSSPLLLLYGQALTWNGELYLAGRVLEKLPSGDGQVLRARAYLLFRQGHHTQAEALVRTAQHYGLTRQASELALAELRVNSGRGDARLLRSLLQLARDRALSARQRSMAHLLCAVLQQRLGQRELARATLSRALVNRPLTDPGFRIMTAELLLDLHDLQGAHREASEASRLAPRELRLVDLLARVELGMDRPQAAIQRLRGLEDLEVAARLTLVEAYLRAGQPQPAASLLQRITEEHPRLRLLRARLHLVEQRPDLALRELGRRGHGGEATTEAYLLRGQTALAMQDSAEASRWFRAALARDSRQAEAWLQLGRIALAEGDAAAARKQLERAILSNPHLRSAQLELGQLLMVLRDWPAARDRFEEALALEPGSLPALLGQARACVELDGKDSPLYLRALSVRGNQKAAEVLAARLLMVRGEWRKAAEQLGRLLASGAASIQPELGLWTAQALHRQGSLAAAEHAYLRALERGGRVPEAHLGLSELDLQRGRISTALLHASAALDQLSGIYPESLRATIKLHLARCQRQAGAVGAAIVELQDILSKDAGHAAAHLALGQIYTSLKNTPRAIQHLAAALRNDPASTEARNRLQDLCRGQRREGCPAAP